MSEIKRKWERLSIEEKDQVKEELIQFFEEEREEKIGIIAANEILNFILKSAGAKLYNMGVEDAKKVLSRRYKDIQFDLDDLLDL